MISSNSSARPRRFPGSFRWILIFLAAMLLLMSACGNKPAPVVETETVVAARVVTLQPSTVPDGAEAPGTVRAVKVADVSARTMGTITQVAVKAGDRVAAGQLLAQIDDREALARRSAAQSGTVEAATAREQAAHALEAAEAQAAVARKTYDRFVYLREQKSISQQEFDEAEGKYRAATAAVGLAKARQQQTQAGGERAQSELRAAEAVSSYARVVAPFAGIVVKRIAEPGQMAMNGQPLFVLEDAEHFEFAATVDARAASGRIQRGSKARVRLDLIPDGEWEATVSEMEAGADPATQTILVKLALPQAKSMQSGLFGRVTFCCGERKTLTVPKTAIVERGQLTGIYALDAQNIARLRIVTLGRQLGQNVEILSGAEAGDRVVVDPGSHLLDGKKVTVAP